MEELKSNTKELFENAKGLVETYYDLAILTAAKKTTDIAAGTLILFGIMALATLILLFLSLALAWWLGDLLQSRTGGFLLGAGIYFVLLIFLFLGRKKIIAPFLKNLITREAYD